MVAEALVVSYEHGKRPAIADVCDRWRAGVGQPSRRDGAAGAAATAAMLEDYERDVLVRRPALGALRARHAAFLARGASRTARLSLGMPGGWCAAWRARRGGHHAGVSTRQVAALDEQWVDFQAATKALETAVMLRATTRLSAVNEYRLEAGAAL